MKKLIVFLVLLSLMGLVAGWYGVSTSSQRFVSFGTTVPERAMIEVISPERGQEVWTFDHLQTVKWRYRGLTGEYLGFNMGEARIHLWFSNGIVCHIGSAPIIKGRFSFILKENQPCNNVPRKITPGQYRIMIIAGSQNFFIEGANNPGIILMRYENLNITTGSVEGLE